MCSLCKPFTLLRYIPDISEEVSGSAFEIVYRHCFRTVAMYFPSNALPTVRPSIMQSHVLPNIHQTRSNMFARNLDQSHRAVAPKQLAVPAPLYTTPTRKCMWNKRSSSLHGLLSQIKLYLETSALGKRDSRSSDVETHIPHQCVRFQTITKTQM